jgi:ADP-heptose:LPS heptosyltransferase
MIRDLFLGSPYIEVMETNRRDMKGLLHLWQKFHSSDIVVTQYAGKHGGQFGLASKLAARALAKRGALIGFKDVSGWNKFLFNHLLPVRPDYPVVEHEREALRAAGLEVYIPYPRLVVEKRDAVLERFQLTAGEYIVSHFFAGNPGRSISPLKARELVVELQKEFPGTTLVLSGGGDDRQQAEEIVEGLQNVLVVAGSVSLQDMMQVLGASRGVVSVDTGVAHISAQLEVPLVVLRTCLGPNWWFPEQYGPNIPAAQFSREDLCMPKHIKKNYPDCINEVAMREVANGAKKYFI